MRRACAEGPARPAPRAARGGARGGARRRRHRAVVGGGRHPHPRHRAPVPAARRATSPRSSARSCRRCGWSPRSRPSPAGIRRAARGRRRRAAAVRPVHLDGGRRRTVVGPDPPARRRRARPRRPPTDRRALAVQHAARRRGPPRRAGKPATALDAMLVCHVAGCSRVTGSASGVPQAGEAGCDERWRGWSAGIWTPCRASSAVRGHSAEHRRRPRPGRPRRPRAGPRPPGAAAPARRSTRRLLDPGLDRRPDGLHPARSDRGPLRHRGDPARARGGVRGLRRLEGRPGDPLGRLLGRARLEPEAATTRRVGRATCSPRDRPVRRRRRARRRLAHRALVPRPRQVAAGQVRDLAGPVLGSARRDQDGWGRRYSGGGVYDVRDATGGHYDHVHVSFRE